MFLCLVIQAKHAPEFSGGYSAKIIFSKHSSAYHINYMQLMVPILGP
jgi:hypothetical protein